jgi:hypothetical protein
MQLWLLGGLGSAFFNSFIIVGSAFYEVPLDQSWFWWGIACWASYYIPFFVLLLQIATAQLTFESDNRSTGIRLTCSAIFWISIGWLYLAVGAARSGALAGLGSFWSPDHQSIWGVSVLLALWIGLVGLFAATEDDPLSRRIRRDLPRSRLQRILYVPFLPGGGRGYLYCLLHLGLLAALMIPAAVQLGGSRDDSVEFIGAICCYVTIYLGLGSLLGRVIRRMSADIRAAHARVLTLFLVAGGSILPHLLSIYDFRWWQQYPLLYITDPFSTCVRITDSTAASWTPVFLFGGAAATMLANFRPLARGISEVISAPVKPRRASPVASATAETG